MPCSGAVATANVSGSLSGSRNVRMREPVACVILDSFATSSHNFGIRLVFETSKCSSKMSPTLARRERACRSTLMPRSANKLESQERTINRALK